MTSQLESQNQRFNEASAMVLAASDLLSAASKAGAEKLSLSLDNNTLHNLAEAIYREVQVAEMLYIQLSEMFEQARCEQITLYSSYPQVAIPLSKLNHPQLLELIEVSRENLETIEANVNQPDDHAHHVSIKLLHQTISDIRIEIAKRG